MPDLVPLSSHHFYPLLYYKSLQQMVGVQQSHCKQLDKELRESQTKETHTAIILDTRPTDEKTSRCRAEIGFVFSFPCGRACRHFYLLLPRAHTVTTGPETRTAVGRFRRPRVD